ncbi:MAG: PhzF family phenazine biosynthesis protein [Defluviitaleaceae bacterium]|nr:PhzF family phenazine biosynthesis protein [Defluviitaleaceae bacterium]
MKYFIVDAFTDELFKGNQAGVCITNEWPDDYLMQKIAFENNLSETAFVVKQGSHYGLRWFTPKVEVDLCGHATLAAAYVVLNFSEISAANTNVQFETKSGILTVTKVGDLYEMDFPSREPRQIELTANMCNAIGATALEAHLSRDLVLLLDSEQQVRDLSPNFDLIKQLGYFAVVVTAKGIDIDFVSRFFTPGAGVPEDPVTGSAHSTLIPFWAKRLGKDKMVARQLSARGGTLYCENHGERVKISGKAVLYLQGEIFVEDNSLA